MQSQVLSMLLQPAERSRRIIRAAYVAAVPVYVAVVYVMSRVHAPQPIAPFVRAMILPLAILSVVCAMVSRWLPGLLLSERRIRELLEKEPAPETLARNPLTGVVDADRLNRIRMLSVREQRLLPVISASFVPFVVQLALCEAIGLFGFVLGVLSQSVVIVLPFAAVALALLLTVSPKFDPILEAANRLTIHNAAQTQL